jgi:hypothetical protein
MVLEVNKYIVTYRPIARERLGEKACKKYAMKNR